MIHFYFSKPEHQKFLMFRRQMEINIFPPFYSIFVVKKCSKIYGRLSVNDVMLLGKKGLEYEKCDIYFTMI
jgi:hypothetical protein